MGKLRKKTPVIIKTRNANGRLKGGELGKQKAVPAYFLFSHTHTHTDTHTRKKEKGKEKKTRKWRRVFEKREISLDDCARGSFVGNV